MFLTSFQATIWLYLYNLTVSHFGNSDSLVELPWHFGIAFVTQAIACTLVQVHVLLLCMTESESGADVLRLENLPHLAPSVVTHCHSGPSSIVEDGRGSGSHCFLRENRYSPSLPRSIRLYCDHSNGLICHSRYVEHFLLVLVLESSGHYPQSSHCQSAHALVARYVHWL